MKKSLILFLALIFLTPTLGFSRIFTFKAGLYIPRGQSDLWTTEFDQMSFTKNNYINTNFGFAYEYFLTREASIVIGVDSYSKNKLGTYVDYAGISLIDGDFAFPIDDYVADFFPAHAFNVTVTPIQLSIKLTPIGRTGKIIPYIGGGVGLYLWNVRLTGDLVDFDDVWVYVPDNIDIYPIISVSAWENNKLSFGYHAFGGVMVPFTRRMTIEVEFKYNRAEGELTQGFEGFEPFDLTAYQVSLGLNYWF